MPTFDAIGIIVEDMATTLGFYRLLGLDIPDAAEDEQHVDIEVVDGFRLMFDTIDVVEKFSTYAPPSGGRGVALAFRCATPDEVDALYERVVRAGHASKQEPFDAFWGQRYATVVDPDGNPVDLYAPSE